MLRIIHRARRCGKTFEAVKLANETGAYLVVRDRAEADRINELYKPDRFPITFAELDRPEAIHKSFVRNFVIDNGDDWIRYWFNSKGATCDAITVSVVDSIKQEWPENPTNNI